MSSQGLNSLATIIKRLEAATSRLEDIAVAQSGGAITFPESKPARPASTILAPSNVNPNPAAAAPPGGPPKFGSVSSLMGPDSVPATVTAFDERVMNGKLGTFLSQTEGLGQPKLVEQSKVIQSLFKNTRAVILCASACMKPTDAEFATLVKPFYDDLGTVTKLKDEMRFNRDWSLHLQVVADGAPCVGWVQAPANPGAHVKEMKEAAEFYANKIITAYKDKDKKHVDWVRSYIGLIDELYKYVVEYHKMGLVWNPKGGKAVDFGLASAAGASVAPGPPPPAPPPPPPPPPPTLDIIPSLAAEPESSGTAAVFAQINQGADITKGLRKVDKSEMTHKNPSLRASGPVPARAPSPSPTAKTPPKPKKPASLQAKKPAKWELQGTKWVIEHHENERELVLENASINQIVTLYGCKNSVLQIKGKINGISMTNCQKTSLVVDSTVSVISITNCQSFQLQVIGSAPTIQIETTDSGQVFLSKASVGAEIITAKCSAINISVPVDGPDGEEFKENPVPEMLRTVIVDGKLVTSIVEHSG